MVMKAERVAQRRETQVSEIEVAKDEQRMARDLR
jgi:hypothetical protein